MKAANSVKPQKEQIFLVGIVLMIALIWLGIAFQQRQSLDQRVNSVAAQVKCPICQGESIADSSTTIAQQMRMVAREQLQSGRSEQEVLQYFRDHYGNQIVLTPSWNGFALLAWLVPFALVLGGIFFLVRILREWRANGSTLSVESGVVSNEDEGRQGAEFAEAELAAYRKQLEQELAADDRLFKK